MAGLMDFLQAASNAAASNVSGPIDLLSWALNKAGVPVGTAVGGSDWMKQQGLMRDVPQSGASLAGETVGLLAPIGMAAKAPQIASGLLAGQDLAKQGAMSVGQRGADMAGDYMAKSGLLQPATVWHGSPHKFDKFDASKIGTGEGAQAYGHGLYLADAQDVARIYSADRGYVGAAMAGKPQAINYDDPAWLAQKTIDELGDPAKAKAHLEMVARTAAKHMSPESAAGVKGAIDMIASGSVGPKGNLYKVDLPDTAIAKMLDWDATLSQQPAEVQSALKSMVGDVTGGGFDLSRAPRNVRNAFDYGATQAAEAALSAKYGVTKTASGWVDKSGRVIPQDSVDKMLAKLGGKGYENAGQLYNDLTHITGSQADISATLRNNGIPGIRYLDGGSRGAGQGTSNYVVFPGNEGLLSILERNGMPLK